MRVAATCILLGALASAASGEAAYAAAPFPVDVELVFAIDISGSIDHNEADLQRDAVVAAVRSEDFLTNVRSGRLGSVALTVIGYSSGIDNRTLVDWHLVRERTLANDFAEALAAAPMTPGRRTSMSGGIAIAAGLFESNNFEGARKIVLLLGDGKNNYGFPMDTARDEAVARGVTIIGLPLTLMLDNAARATFPDLNLYFASCVAGGQGAFIQEITTPEDVTTALNRALGATAPGPDGLFQDRIGTGRGCDQGNDGIQVPPH